MTRIVVNPLDMKDPFTNLLAVMIAARHRTITGLRTINLVTTTAPMPLPQMMSRVAYRPLERPNHAVRDPRGQTQVHLILVVAISHVGAERKVLGMLAGVQKVNSILGELQIVSVHMRFSLSILPVLSTSLISQILTLVMNGSGLGLLKNLCRALPVHAVVFPNVSTWEGRSLQ